MRKRSILLKITFFGLLLAGFIVMQCSWVHSLRKDRLQEFYFEIVRGINGAMLTMPLHTETSISKALSRELKDVPFEFSIGVNRVNIASHGFNQKMLNSADNLVLYYQLTPDGENKLFADQLTVVVPKKFAYNGMGWIIAASLFLTLITAVIFYCAIVLIEQKQQLLYENRTNVIKDMMQKLETPLSTVSVAAEALSHARVMQDAGKIHYYQQVINEENKRMNEQVNKMLQDFGE